MANPTTYFGWVMPNSADLVTDLPADFAVFGQGVDTSMQYLLGGTTGQVLSKTSGTNMAFTWTTPTDQVPLTTKGDLFTFSTVDARLPVGTNKFVLGADSTQTTGLAWQASPQSTLTTTGDILYASAANTPARLGIGTTGQVLNVSGGIPSWATASLPSFSGCNVYKTSTQALTLANTLYAITYEAETLDTSSYHSTSANTERITVPTTGVYRFTFAWSSNNTNMQYVHWYKNGTEFQMNEAAGQYDGEYGCIASLTANDYIEIRISSVGTGQTIFGSTAFGYPTTIMTCQYLGA